MKTQAIEIRSAKYWAYLKNSRIVTEIQHISISRQQPSIDLAEGRISGAGHVRQEASGSSVLSASDFGATLRQARMRALLTMASLACASTTFVTPSRPQPPGTGTKALGDACMSMACCSGVSWIVATEAAGHSKLANDFRHTRKSERPLRKLSTASG
jgi:hypothetical protein